MTGRVLQKKALVAWLCFVACFVVYLTNANTVYHALSGKSYAVKLPAATSLHACGNLQVTWGFDPVPFNNKLEEGKEFIGLMNRISPAAGDARARVFFKSSDALYEVLPNRHPLCTDTGKVEVNFFASTIGMENGIYQVGLYLTGSQGPGFVWLNSFFEKGGGGCVDYIARPVAVTPTATSADLQFAIESVSTADDEFVVQGWAVLAHADMNQYCAYLKLKGPKNVEKVFYTPLYTRWDIAALYDDGRAANSGFLIKIPRSAIARGKQAVKVMVKSLATGEIIQSGQAITRNF